MRDLPRLKAATATLADPRRNDLTDVEDVIPARGPSITSTAPSTPTRRAARC